MNNFPPPPPGGQPPYQPPPGQPGQPGQPQQPGQPPQPGQQQPTGQYQQPDPYQQQQYQQPEDPLTALDKKRKKQLWILSGIAAVLIVGAFFGGKAVEKKNYDPGADGYNAIYDAGAKSGNAAGTKSGEASGQKQGKEEGIAEGTEKGKQQGEAEGTAAGASAALGGFSSWSTSAPYVVSMNQGPNSNVPYAVDSRTLMQPNTFYKICASGQGVCTEADPNSGGGSTGP